MMVETYGTEHISKSKILELVTEHFDLRPGAFRQYLNLHRPIYQKTAAYGHFGRRPFSGTYRDNGKQQKVDFFTWEQTDRVKDLLSAAR